MMMPASTNSSSCLPGGSCLPKPVARRPCTLPGLLLRPGGQHHGGGNVALADFSPALPRSVAELLQPPTLPQELTTPSPTTTARLFSAPSRKVSAKSDTSDEGRAGSLSPALPNRRTSRPIHQTTTTTPTTATSKKRLNSIINSGGSDAVVLANSRRQTENLNLVRKLSASVQCGSSTATARGVEPKKPLKGGSSSGVNDLTAARKPLAASRAAAVAARKISLPAGKISATAAGHKSPLILATPLREQNRIPGESGRRLGDQPDLVKESLSKERGREVERAKEEAKSASEAASRTAKSFDVMAVVAGYYMQRLEELESEVQLERSAWKQLEGQRSDSAKEAEERLEAARSDLTSSHQLALASLHQDFQLERGQLLSRLEQSALEATARAAAWSQERASMEQQLGEEKAALQGQLLEVRDAGEQRLSREMVAVEARFGEEKAALEARLEAEKAALEAEKASLEAQLREEKAALEEKMREEKAVLEERLAKVETRKGSDHRMDAAKAKVCTLEQEVESLRSVLEMRTTELHESRLSRVKLEERVEELEQREEAWRRANALVEDLREQLAARMEQERRLQEELRLLSTQVEKEAGENKRLIMENEQLNWRMNQEASSLSFSYCEGTDHSLPILGAHRNSFRGRPLSAPPGKTAGAAHRGQDWELAVPPDSPRVLEVVEKTESVAWKLEYDLPFFPEASPTTKRKLSPQSPLVLRKCKSSGLMTKSLDRSGLVLTRSNSTPGPSATSSPAVSRSNSVRRRILPTFETLCESTESESDDSKKSSPERPPRAAFRQPAPVDIGPALDDELVEISSSSEIEIGGADDTVFSTTINNDTATSVVVLDDDTMATTADWKDAMTSMRGDETGLTTTNSSSSVWFDATASLGHHDDSVEEAAAAAAASSSVGHAHYHHHHRLLLAPLVAGDLLVTSDSEPHSPVTEVTLRSGAQASASALAAADMGPPAAAEEDDSDYEQLSSVSDDDGELDSGEVAELLEEEQQMAEGHS